MSWRFTRDPSTSRYPEPLSAEEARAEVRRAKRHCRRVPVGHPYAVAPTWTPFWLAKITAALHAATLGKPKKRARRRSSRSGHFGRI